MAVFTHVGRLRYKIVCQFNKIVKLAKVFFVVAKPIKTLVFSNKSII